MQQVQVGLQMAARQTARLAPHLRHLIPPQMLYARPTCSVVRRVLVTVVRHVESAAMLRCEPSSKVVRYG